MKELQTIFQTRKHTSVHTYTIKPPAHHHQENSAIHTDPIIQHIQWWRDVLQRKPEYEKALQEAGHKTDLTFTTNSTNARQRNKRKRTKTWFNPLYSQHIKVNIGKKFLNLIGKHFPKESQLHKICNRNTLKLSYSCMSNIEAWIKAHNSKTINSNPSEKPDTCNCRKKEEYPLPGHCTIANIIYQATVDTQITKTSYIRFCATPFKIRYALHKASFNHEAKSSSTELSKYIWGLHTEMDNIKTSTSILPSIQKMQHVLMGKILHHHSPELQNWIRSLGDFTSLPQILAHKPLRLYHPTCKHCCSEAWFFSISPKRPLNLFSIASNSGINISDNSSSSTITIPFLSWKYQINQSLNFVLCLCHKRKTLKLIVP